MFKKGKPKTKSSRIDTLIGQGTEINGDIIFSGGLRIDGNVNGNIYTLDDEPAVLTLSEQGVIQGKVKVSSLIINGTVIGDVYSTSHVELAPKAKIKGNIYYNLLEMSMGAAINGQLIHRAEGMEVDRATTNIQHDSSNVVENLDITTD